MDSPEPQRSVVREPGQWRYWMFRVAAAVVPRVPYVVAGPLAVAVGAVIWAASPAARRRVEANLAHVPALAGDQQARAAAVRGVFCHLALNYVDLFRARCLSEQSLLRQWHLDGMRHYEAACAAGRGVILITGHLGNFDHAVGRLGLFGTPITIPVERLKPERLFALVCGLRSHHGFRTVPTDSREGLRALLAALRRGEAVLLAVDRDVLGTGVAVPLFGAPARLPTGAAVLAQRSGAPVLWAGVYRVGLWRSYGVFTPVALPRDTASAEPAGAGDTSDRLGVDRLGVRARERGAMAPMLAAIAAELEHQVASHPEQWVASLSRIWDEYPSVPAALRDDHVPADTTGFSP